MDIHHTYAFVHPSNRIYEGIPKKHCKSHVELPLYCSLLFKIATIPMGKIIWGKKSEGFKLIDQDFRQYEFDLHSDPSNGWGIMHLYIKEKEHFFKSQSFELLHNGAWQKIPLTYKTMSKMSQEELSIIWQDFD